MLHFISLQQLSFSYCVCHVLELLSWDIAVVFTSEIHVVFGASSVVQLRKVYNWWQKVQFSRISCVVSAIVSNIASVKLHLKITNTSILFDSTIYIKSGLCIFGGLRPGYEHLDVLCARFCVVYIYITVCCRLLGQRCSY